MKRAMLLMVALAMIVSITAAQDRPRPTGSAEKKVDDVDQMIANALNSNPDVLVAEAKVREAEAELHRVRTRVAQEVVAYKHQRSLAALTAKSAMVELERKAQMFKTGVVDSGTLQEAEIAAERAKAEVENLEAEGRYLLGTPKGDSKTEWKERLLIDVTRNAPTTHETAEATPPRPRPNLDEDAFLSAPITVSFKEVPIGDAIAAITQAAAQVTSARMPFTIDESMTIFKVTIDASDLSVGKILTMIADRNPHIFGFVFRPYGLYVTSANNAERIWGAAIPAETPVLRSVVPQAPSNAGGTKR